MAAAKAPVYIETKKQQSPHVIYHSTQTTECQCLCLTLGMWEVQLGKGGGIDVHSNTPLGQHLFMIRW